MQFSDDSHIITEVRETIWISNLHSLWVCRIHYNRNIRGCVYNQIAVVVRQHWNGYYLDTCNNKNSDSISRTLSSRLQQFVTSVPPHLAYRSV